MKIKYIIQSSDYHLKIKNYNDFVHIFNEFHENIISNNLNRNNTIHVICGDILDNPKELNNIELLYLFNIFINFVHKTEITTLIIPGNHDLNYLNPLFENIEKKNIIYSSKTEIINIYGINIGHVHYSDTKTIKLNCEILLYHGLINNFRFDNELIITNEKTFDNKLVLLGDIHKRQIKSGSNIQSYCGSLIQQNFSENLFNHGFIIWSINHKEIKNYTHKEIDLININGKIYIKKINNELHFKLNNEYVRVIDYIDKFPKTIYYKIIKDISDDKNNNKSDISINEYSINEYNFDKFINNNFIFTGFKNIKNYHTKYIIKKEIKDDFENSLDEDEKKILNELIKGKSINEYYNNKIQNILHKIKDIDINNIEQQNFTIEYLEFENIFQFQEFNYINFTNLTKSINLISGKNGSGKSNLIKIILLALYGHNDTNHNIVTDKCTVGYVQIIIRLENSSILNIKRTFSFKKTIKFEIKNEKGKLLIAKSKEDKNDYILKFIIDKDLFLKTCILEQFSFDNYLNYPKQINVIEKILKIDYINYIIELIKIYINEQNNILDNISIDVKDKLEELFNLKINSKDDLKYSLNTISCTLINTEINKLTNENEILLYINENEKIKRANNEINNLINENIKLTNIKENININLLSIEIELLQKKYDEYIFKKLTNENNFLINDNINQKNKLNNLTKISKNFYIDNTYYENLINNLNIQLKNKKNIQNDNYNYLIYHKKQKLLNKKLLTMREQITLEDIINLEQSSDYKLFYTIIQNIENLYISKTNYIDFVYEDINLTHIDINLTHIDEIDIQINNLNNINKSIENDIELLNKYQMIVNINLGIIKWINDIPKNDTEFDDIQKLIEINNNQLLKNNNTLKYIKEDKNIIEMEDKNIIEMEDCLDKINNLKDELNKNLSNYDNINLIINNNNERIQKLTLEEKSYKHNYKNDQLIENYPQINLENYLVKDSILKFSNNIINIKTYKQILLYKKSLFNNDKYNIILSKIELYKNSIIPKFLCNLDNEFNNLINSIYYSNKLLIKSIFDDNCINITINNKKFQDLSGYEKICTNLILHIILSKKINGICNFLFLDEVFICCDDKNKEKLPEFLENIKPFFDKIILTSHSSYIINKIIEEDAIEIIKINNINKLSNIKYGDRILNNNCILDLR